MAQFASLLDEHAAFHGDGAPVASSSRSEFSLDGLPVSDGAELMDLARKHGANR